MSVFLSPIGNTQQFDDNGNPLVGGWWSTFAAGTTTPITTFTSSTGLVAQPANILLDAGGRPANPIWLTGGLAVKFQLFSAAAVLLETWDDVTGVGDSTAAASSEWVPYSPVASFVSATSFAVAGNQTNVFTVGRRVRTQNTGGTIYGTIVSSVFAASTTVTVVNDAGVLDTGLSAVAFGLLASVSSSIPANLDPITSINGGPLAGWRNILGNGGFTINQMVYTSGAVLAAGAYGHDMWKAGASGGDYTFAQLSSDTTITIGATKSLIQVVEAQLVQATSYVLSWQGTATARFGVNSAVPSGAYAASPILITGQSVGTVMSVEFTNGALGKVQLERGTAASQASSFEQRPFALEFVQCQRYYEVQTTTEREITQDVTNATAYTHGFGFKVTKRISNPAITLTNNMTGFGAPTVSGVGFGGYRVVATASATLPARLFSFSATIDARL